MTGFNSDSFIERWRQLTLLEQMGNIGSEVERVIAWRKKGNTDLAMKALHRSLTLLDLTITDPRWQGGSLKELTRVREVLCDAFIGDNVYNTPPEYLSKYFYVFAAAARRKSGA
jgi:hypothetical protein